VVRKKPESELQLEKLKSLLDQKSHKKKLD
jgi:hypothetical protein